MPPSLERGLTKPMRSLISVSLYRISFLTPLSVTLSEKKRVTSIILLACSIRIITLGERMLIDESERRFFQRKSVSAGKGKKAL